MNINMSISSLHIIITVRYRAHTILKHVCRVCPDGALKLKHLGGNRRGSDLSCPCFFSSVRTPFFSWLFYHLPAQVDDVDSMHLKMAEKKGERKISEKIKGFNCRYKAQG